MDGEDQPLPMVAVSSMADVMERAKYYDPQYYQLYFALESSLYDSVEVAERMRPGVKGTGFALFNPEVVRLKVEAEEASKLAISRAERSVARAGLKVEKTQQMIEELESLIGAGSYVVRVGPSINRRSLSHDQVVYAYGENFPEQDVLTPRKLSRKRKLQSRGIDADSQMAFWEVNLDALRKKHAGQVAYRDHLTSIAEGLRASLLYSPTLIGSGYSDFTFRF